MSSWQSGSEAIVITSLAAALRDLMVKEATRLDGEDITHGPTIGAMYEGLTRDILDRVVPSSLDLQIVSGFAEGHDGTLSPQLDVMLVTGVGRALPYGAGYVWPIDKVIAVLEVKKNLYGADLADAFLKLRAVMHIHVAKLRTNRSLDLRSSFHAYAMLTGRYLRTWEEVQALPQEQRYIFYALMDEQTAPVRAVIGYHGYANEHSLRQGLIDYLESILTTPQGFGITSFPNLIASRQNSILKLNGQPYIVPTDNDWWPAVASNDENPLRLLIELIWTRLSNEFEAAMPGDDSLMVERLAPLISARLQQDGARLGWQYRFEPIGRRALEEGKAHGWEPGAVTEDEYVFLNVLASAGDLDIRDEDFVGYAAKHGFDPDALVRSLVERRIIAWSGPRTVRLIDVRPLATTFLPDGRVVASSEHDMLDLWLKAQLKD